MSVHADSPTHRIVLSSEPETKIFALTCMATLQTLPVCPTREAFSSPVVRSHTLHDTGVGTHVNHLSSEPHHGEHPETLQHHRGRLNCGFYRRACTVQLQV